MNKRERECSEQISNLLGVDYKVKFLPKHKGGELEIINEQGKSWLTIPNVVYKDDLRSFLFSLSGVSSKKMNILRWFNQRGNLILNIILSLAAVGTLGFVGMGMMGIGESYFDMVIIRNTAFSTIILSLLLFPFGYLYDNVEGYIAKEETRLLDKKFAPSGVDCESIIYTLFSRKETKEEAIDFRVGDSTLV